jgi:hypothetical protein
MEEACEQNEYRKNHKKILHYQPRGQRSIRCPTKRQEENETITGHLAKYLTGGRKRPTLQCLLDKVIPYHCVLKWVVYITRDWKSQWEN